MGSPIIITRQGDIIALDINNIFSRVASAKSGDRVHIYYPTDNDYWAFITVNDVIVADKRNAFQKFADWVLNVFGINKNETYRCSSYIFDEGSLQPTEGIRGKE